jgi:hypothetical protein
MNGAGVKRVRSIHDEDVLFGQPVKKNVGRKGGLV